MVFEDESFILHKVFIVGVGFVIMKDLEESYTIPFFFALLLVYFYIAISRGSGVLFY